MRWNVVGPELFNGLWQNSVYALTALTLLMIGYVVIDLLTPGRLADLIWKDRNLNAVITTCSGMFAIGWIVRAALPVLSSDLGTGLLTVTTYGLLGILLFAFAFKVIDLLTPGNLGETVTAAEFHPAVFVTATVSIMLGLTFATIISG